MKKASNEIMTGAMVLVCCIILLFVFMKIGNFPFFKKGYPIRVQFSFVSGVQKHAPVHLSGVDVGEVKDIRLSFDQNTRVELDLWLQEGVKVTKDAQVSVATLGLMGEKYVEIETGDPSAGYLNPGELLVGEEPFQMEQLIAKGTKIADNLDLTLADTRRLVNNLNSVVDNQKDRIDHLMVNLEDTSVNMKQFSEDIKWHPWKFLIKGKEHKLDWQETDESRPSENKKPLRSNVIPA